jgi:hypothetical protein
LKTYTEEELSKVIESHGKWLRNEGGVSANLAHASLAGANLAGAYLTHANLAGAYLTHANLTSADLTHANLLCTGNMHNIKTIQADIWRVGYTHDTLQIGCQRHLITEWLAFSDEEISRMDSKALSWWKIWKPILMNVIEVSPANPTNEVTYDYHW